MRLKIAEKTGLGFGIITVAVILSAWITINALQKSRCVNETITQVYTPSQLYMNELYTLMSNSRKLTKSWVFVDKIADTPDKIRLQKLQEGDYHTKNITAS